MERKRLLGEISKNFWEFDWVRAHHLMTRYYPLLPVITCYYIIWREKDYSVKFLRISGNLIGYARIIILRVIPRYYPLLPVITLCGEKKTRKRLLGEISKNFWEFDWVRANHLMNSYYALLPVITCYYLLLHYVERKRLLGEISKNFREFDWVRARHLMTSYCALLPVITRCYLLLPVITLERKRLLGEISKNFWEFDWVGVHHLITSYYALLL